MARSKFRHDVGRPSACVHRDRGRRLEVRPAHRGVDQQADLGRGRPRPRRAPWRRPWRRRRRSSRRAATSGARRCRPAPPAARGAARPAGRSSASRSSNSAEVTTRGASTPQTDRTDVLSKRKVALPVMHSLSWSGSCSAGLRGTFGGSASRARRRQADRPTTTLPCRAPSRPYLEPAPRRPIADSGRITALACSAHSGLHVGPSSRRDLAPRGGTRMPDRYPSVAITRAGSRGIGWPGTGSAARGRGRPPFHPSSRSGFV